MKNSNIIYYSDDSFKQFVVISLVLHLSLVLLFSVKSILLPSQIIEIPKSIRVDVVALPDKIEDVPKTTPIEQKTAAPVEKKEKVKPVEKTPPVAKPESKKISLQDTKKSQKQAFEKLKALEAIEKIKNEVSKEEALAKLQQQKAPQYKGNIISSGNSFTGLSRLRVNEYLEKLTTQVHDHYVLPQWLSNANLKAAVVIEIDARGYVVKKDIHTSSGNSIFDASCLQAVIDASPFDPPPNEVKGALIMVRFPFE